MSDTEKLLARLAQMEQELASLRSPKAAPADPNQINIAMLQQQFVSDPVGTMARLGLPQDHITRVLVASAMGEQAPPELKVLAAMGPQVSAQRALDAKLETLSRRIEDFSSQGKLERFKALASDKSKHPHLAKAYAADPSLFDEDIAAGGTAEELATKMEARLSKVAAVYSPPPASDANAEPVVQSSQDQPALTGTPLQGVPPIPPQQKPGVFTQEDHVRLRDEIVRKFASVQEPPK